jgi:general stress protein 26
MTDRISLQVRRLKALLKGIPVGMLTTQTPDGEHRSRPMLVQDFDSTGWLWFVSDRSSRKACELLRSPDASVVFQSPRGDRFIVVHGIAVVVHDDVKVRRMWNPTYRAWFPRGLRDSQVALIALRVITADYWLVPRTRITRGLGAVKALVTRRRYEARKRGTLDLLHQTTVIHPSSQRRASSALHDRARSSSLP